MCCVGFFGFFFGFICLGVCYVGGSGGSVMGGWAGRVFVCCVSRGVVFSLFVVQFAILVIWFGLLTWGLRYDLTLYLIDRLWRNYISVGF